ncbi:MAG: dTDP-4-dehydro-6-deoxyglucose aminotransferase [Bradyrhizobium sp.]|nr:dTDP-4-dehydro-6-deoxyglucose aminotransferase [Bradyrhizobium sp.]
MKVSIDDLAVFGGQPAFSRALHVGRPNIGERDRFLHRMKDILDSRILTNAGPYVREFEGRIADELGVAHCIATSSGTTALEVLIRALELKGEVIVPGFTFVATVHALTWLGLTPVFCDVAADTHNLDPTAVKRLITKNVTAILGVHLWGRPCPVDELTGIADDHGLSLIFDAAHAFLCDYNGRMIGNFGRAEVFSFNATKFVNAFEGGAITTNDDGLAAKLRRVINHGRDFDDVECLGTNGRMPEASAAMGITSLESADAFIGANRRNYQKYREELAGLAGLELVTHPAGSNYQYIVVEVDDTKSPVNRDLLCAVLRAENILAKRYFYPACHQMPPYAGNGISLPAAERLSRNVLLLPTGTSVTSDDVSAICGIVRFTLNRAAEVKLGIGRLPPRSFAEQDEPALADSSYVGS